jgi:hypothetical protein
MRVSFHRLLPREIVKRRYSTEKGTCLRDKANKTKTFFSLSTKTNTDKLDVTLKLYSDAATIFIYEHI